MQRWRRCPRAAASPAGEAAKARGCRHEPAVPGRLPREAVCAPAPLQNRGEEADKKRSKGEAKPCCEAAPAGPPNCPARAHAALARATLRSRSLVLSQRRWGAASGEALPRPGKSQALGLSVPSPPQGTAVPGAPVPFTAGCPRGSKLLLGAGPWLAGQSPAGSPRPAGTVSPSRTQRVVIEEPKKVVAGGGVKERRTNEERERNQTETREASRATAPWG